MPRMIGTGLRKRAASKSANSCVLSPISASATTPAETRNASITLLCSGRSLGNEEIDHGTERFPLARASFPRLVVHAHLSVGAGATAENRARVSHLART